MKTMPQNATKSNREHRQTKGVNHTRSAGKRTNRQLDQEHNQKLVSNLIKAPINLKIERHKAVEDLAGKGKPYCRAKDNIHRAPPTTVTMSEARAKTS